LDLDFLSFGGCVFFFVCCSLFNVLLVSNAIFVVLVKFISMRIFIQSFFFLRLVSGVGMDLTLTLVFDLLD